MQYLLKNNRFFNSTQTAGEAFNPFELVHHATLSTETILTTNAANFSPIANVFPAEKPNTSSPSSTSSISMQSPSFCSKRDSTGKKILS